MSVSRFTVMAHFDGTGAPMRGTVVISRGANPIVRVRALRRRRYYELPLSVVADMVVQSILKSEVRATAEAGGRKRRVKRGALA